MVQQMKRDREEEMIHRGTEYARAIKKFYKKFGRYPANSGATRQHQPDPFSPQALQRPTHQGRQVEAAATTATFRRCSTPTLPELLRRPWRRRDRAHFGRRSRNHRRLARAAQLAFAADQPQRSGKHCLALPPRGFDQSSPGCAQQAHGVRRQLRRRSGNSPQGNAQQGNQFANTFSLDSSNTGQQGSAAGNQPQSGGTASGNQTLGQTFGGGAIVGVASVSKDPTIRIYNKRKTYNEWQFIYNPMMDQVNVLLRGPYQPTIIGGAQVGTPAGQINQQQSPFGQQQSAFGQQPSGFGQQQNPRDKTSAGQPVPPDQNLPH